MLAEGIQYPGYFCLFYIRNRKFRTNAPTSLSNSCAGKS